MNKSFDFNELKLTDRLPSASGTALAILKITQNEDVDIREITRVLQADPALTGKILKLANSAAVGAKRPIVDIHSAAVLIGTKILRNLALSFSIIANNKQGKCCNFNYSNFWTLSVARAVAFQNIAQIDRLVIPEEAFTIGLLSDIGRLAMATIWPEEYNRCLIDSPDETRLIELENEKFSVNHYSLGNLVLEDWGFPKFILKTIEYSHQPNDTENERVIGVGNQLRLACDIADALMTIFFGNQQSLPQTIQHHARKCGMNQFDFEEFIQSVAKDWQEWGKQLDINLSKPKRRASDFHKPKTPAFEESDKSHPLKLLLIDNDLELEEKLTNTGDIVMSCLNGDCAMQSIIKKKPDIVIFNDSLLSQKGTEFCKALRSFEDGKNSYVIMITDCEDEPSLIEAFNAGIDDYVSKPLNSGLLLARLSAGKRVLALRQGLSLKCEELEQSRTALAIANKQLLLQANSDPLTGLPNRRYAQNQLEQLCTLINVGDSVGIVLLDLDYFKSINDNLGHDAGDKVLMHVAKLIRETVRFNDLACRWGGEEFLIIMIDRDPDCPMLTAERLRARIEANQCPDLQQARKLTVSVGVSVCADRNSNWQSVINQADSALYEAKQRGRNTVVLAK